VNSESATESRWSRFWFTPVPTTGIHVVRVLSGLLFLFWLLSLVGHQEGFFSRTGWLDMTAFQELRRQQEFQPADWSILYIAGQNPAIFSAIYWTSIAVIVLFTLGIATRLTSIGTWVIVVSFLANPATSYDGDYLLGILAFHLMIGHVLMGAWSGNLNKLEWLLGSRHDFVFARLLFTKPDEPRLSYGANFMMRLFQIHFTIIVVTSGLHKLQIGDWWSGSALWYTLHPPFQVTLESLKRERATAPVVMFFVSLVQYAALAWQIGFPAFAWRSGVVWRSVLLGGAAIGWVGVLFLFKLPLFGPFFFIGSLCFLNADEWAWLKGRVLSMTQRSAEGKVAREPVKVGSKK